MVNFIECFLYFVSIIVFIRQYIIFSSILENTGSSDIDL